MGVGLRYWWLSPGLGVAVIGDLARIPDIVTYALLIGLYGMSLVGFGFKNGLRHIEELEIRDSERRLVLAASISDTPRCRNGNECLSAPPR